MCLNIHGGQWAFTFLVWFDIIFLDYFCGSTFTDLGYIGSLQSWKPALCFLPVSPCQSRSAMAVLHYQPVGQRQRDPWLLLSSQPVLSLRAPTSSITEHLKHAVHTKGLSWSLHAGPVKTPASQPPLFLVARQPPACKYNIYLYLFYLLLYLKSLGRAQDVDAGDFQRIKYSGKQLVFACTSV